MAQRAAPSLPARLTLAEQIDVQIDRLYALRPVAADDRRSHARTEQLLDGLDDVGRSVRRLGRG